MTRPAKPPDDEGVPERHKPLLPPEHGQFRDMRDEWLFRKWIFGAGKKFITWATAVLILIGLFRQQLTDLAAWFAGGPKP